MPANYVLLTIQKLSCFYLSVVCSVIFVFDGCLQIIAWRWSYAKNIMPSQKRGFDKQIFLKISETFPLRSCSSVLFLQNILESINFIKLISRTYYSKSRWMDYSRTFFILSQNITRGWKKHRSFRAYTSIYAECWGYRLIEDLIVEILLPRHFVTNHIVQ